MMEYLPFIGIAAAVLFAIILFVSSYVKASPSEAIRISGLGKSKVIIGKAGFKIPFFQRSDSLSLEVFQVDIKTSDIPTREFINIDVDGVANLKISSDPEMLEKAFEAILDLSQDDLMRQIQQVLQGNMREIIGTVQIKELVQDRQGVANRVKENVVPDMSKLGIELVNFNIQNFDDKEDVIKNLGIDNIATISRDAQIARANADKDVAIATAKAQEVANEAKANSQKAIIEQDTALSLTQSALKKKSDTAKAEADAAYKLEQQRRQQEINIATVNAEIAQREREVELGNREVELEEKRLAAEVNKKAEAEKFAAQQKADAELYTRQKKAEAEKYELERDSEMKIIAANADMKSKEHEANAVKIQAEAEAAARIAKAEAEKEAALAEAEGIRAVGLAEAEAIEKKAEAMKLYGEAATLQLILDSGVLPKMVEAYSKPVAEAMGRIDSITMYGEGNTAKLTEEITKNGTQIFDGLQRSLGIDIKSVVAGYLGGKMIGDIKNNSNNG
jgi:flotillin